MTLVRWECSAFGEDVLEWLAEVRDDLPTTMLVSVVLSFALRQKRLGDVASQVRLPL